MTPILGSQKARVRLYLETLKQERRELIAGLRNDLHRTGSKWKLGRPHFWAARIDALLGHTR